jgi:hypothetical protein
LILLRVETGSDRSILSELLCLPQQLLRCILLGFILSIASSILKRSTLALVAFLLVSTSLWAAAGGSISGTITDNAGALIPEVRLTLVSQAQKTSYHALSNSQGFYSFLNLPVGRYDLTIDAVGFASKKLTSLAVDTDVSSPADVALEIGSQSQTVTVTSEINAQVDTTTTQLGEVVSGEQLTAVLLASLLS